jgi:FkbM family methyltransferase
MKKTSLSLFHPLKKFIKKTFNLIGFDIAQSSKNPAHSLLGLKNLPIKTIIDVGANEGQFAKEVLKIFPEANLYCFEPLPETFKKLHQWAEKQKGRISAFNFALGDQEGVFEIFNHLHHSSSSSLLKTTEVCERYYPFTKKQVSAQVKVTTLDNWIDSLSVPLSQEVLVKLDVQGYEDRVIRGGQKILSKATACIVEINLDQLYKGQPTFKDIFLLLTDLGYHFCGNLDQVYDDDGHVVFIDAVFVR